MKTSDRQLKILEEYELRKTAARYNRAAIRVINYKDAYLYRHFKRMASNLVYKYQPENQ